MNKFFQSKQELDEFKLWLIALRSEEYKQTKKSLQDENGYCCLGVACKVVIPEDKQLLENNYLKYGYPNCQPNAPKWLKIIAMNFYDKTKTSLTGLNDYGDFTFDEIADCLEAVYLLDVLEE